MTSIGKSIYLEQLAESNALRGHHVCYYHLELTHSRMEDRRMARMSGIPLQKISKEGYNGPEISRAIDQIKAFHERIVYVHCPGWTADRICADITRMHAKGACDLAIVDYLGKIPLASTRGFNEASLIGQNVTAFKNVAGMVGIPVALGSQVNREYKGRGRPKLDDLLGSGEIERQATQVVILHRPEERPDGDHHNETEIVEAYVDKNEGGATGKTTLAHRMGLYRLESPTNEDWFKGA